MLTNIIFQELNHTGCQYACYFRRKDSANEPGFRLANCERFSSASIIKVPILLAWVHLERMGEVNREELCDLDSELEVHGSGFSWLLGARRLPYRDVLLMMIALSDNLCTNLVIERLGLGRIRSIFHEVFRFEGTDLQRKLMDYDARARGLDNWIHAEDMVKMYDLIASLQPEERAWVESMLDVCQDEALLKRNIRRDTRQFFHKTGSMEGVLHDWGYTEGCEIFLLTNKVRDEKELFPIFGKFGELME